MLIAVAALMLIVGAATGIRAGFDPPQAEGLRMNENPYKSPLATHERKPHNRPSLWLALIVGAPVGMSAYFIVRLLLGH